MMRGTKIPIHRCAENTDEDSAWLWWCDEKLGLTEQICQFFGGLKVYSYGIGWVCKSLLKADGITVPLWNSDHVTMSLSAMAQNPTKKNERLHESVKAVFRGQFMDLFFEVKNSC